MKPWRKISVRGTGENISPNPFAKIIPNIMSYIKKHGKSYGLTLRRTAVCRNHRIWTRLFAIRSYGYGIPVLWLFSAKTDIIAEGNKCVVATNKGYILKINGKAFAVNKGINEFTVR